MKIRFDETMKDLDGKAIIGDGKDLTLKQVACNALNLMFQDEQNLSGEEKAMRGLLAMRIYANPDLDLTIDDVALIKKLIGKGYVPLIVAQVWDILEGKVH